MNETEILRVFLAVSDGVMLLGLFFQIFKLRRIKASDEFSLFYVFTGAVNQILWTVYGFVIDDWYIAFIWAVWLVPSLYCSWLVYKYRNNDPADV